jgi:uncharacterized oxidoreductase
MKQAQVVLITGGTMGIGLGLAKAFMAQGAHVAVCGRSAEGLENFSHSYPNALAVQADITNPLDRIKLLDMITTRFGHLSALVNNAGRFFERDFTAPNNPLLELEQEISLNLTTPIALTGEVLNRWPSIETIVFVTSGFALVSPTRAPTYGAVKAGLHGFAEGLRQQLTSRGTHVLELLPTTTDTPGTAGETRKKMTTAEVAKVTLDAIARGRPMALPGPMRLLPTFLRIAPGLTKRMVANI